MRLVKVEQSRASSTLFQTMGLGPWFLGWCVAPRSNPAHGFCGAWVTDDGTGYADLDGTPYKAYVCKACGDKLEGESK